MSVLQGVRDYHSLFGPYGVWLVGMARVLQRPVEAVVSVPGIKYPVHLRLRTTDVSVFRQVLVVTEYAWQLSKLPRVIVDAGANIGLVSVFYANKYPEAKIFAVEPESSNYEMLKKNTALYPNIMPLQRALWKENEELNIVDPGSGNYGFQTLEDQVTLRGELCASSRREGVLGMTVDKLMEDHGLEHIDILKVDIEGSEKEVFENSPLWLGRVGVIVIELHDRLKTGCSRSVYLATKDFEYELRKGETIFLAKKEYATNKEPQPDKLTDSPDPISCPISTKLPYKILQAI